MSYRTYVNGTQIFGNNESYPEWINFIEEQGIEIDNEGCYEGEITDFMGALKIIEDITMRLNKERNQKNNLLREKGYDESHRKLRDMFDLTNIPEEIEKQDKDDKYQTGLLDLLFEVVDNYYAFMPYTFYKICEEVLERDKGFSTFGHFNCFKLKEGLTIKVLAY